MKVAIVVQRCHESVVGGSEALAWQYATLLKTQYQIDLLTTTLEAMAQRTPVLVNGECQVLVDHIMQSSGGKTYKNYRSFSEVIERLLVDQNERAKIANLGRAYVVANYTFDKVLKVLIEAIEIPS